jgi:hypothetical protein
MYVYVFTQSTGDTLARRMLEAAPMAIELDKEYDLKAWTQWGDEYNAWM